VKKPRTSRRQFLRRSLAATLAAPIAASFEESHLLVQQAHGAPQAPSNITSEIVHPNVPASAPVEQCPHGKIGKLAISRLICGGNLISGYAHSRDLIYVSNLLRAYFTDEKIMQTWALCEEHGINTMIFDPVDPHAVEVLEKYRKAGGKIQYLSQLAASPDGMKDRIKEVVDTGAAGILLVGHRADTWSRNGLFEYIGKFVETVKAEGIIAGVAAHSMRTITGVEKAGIRPDFYMKTLHSENYWSKRRPEQTLEVIDSQNDNFWCTDPDAVIRWMQECERPWIAYKVLAAGAIPPKAGFRYAFDNGADFCVVGMFDFQVAEDVSIARNAVDAARNRERGWRG
jgi:hypothetical protein